MTKKPKQRKLAAIFADAHLSRRTWRHRPIEGDSFFAMNQIAERAIEERVEFIIGAGDLIDKRINEPAPIVFLQRWCENLMRHAVQLLFIEGQHEMDAHQHWCNIGGEAVLHLHNNEVQIGDLCLFGLDYTPKDRIKAALDSIPEHADILVAHQVWGDFMGDVALPQCDFGDVPHVAGVITGDFHEMVLEEYRGKQGQDILVFNPGATCMQAISEPHEHYFGWLLEDGSIETEKLKSRSYFEETLRTVSEFEEFLESIPSLLSSVANSSLPAELQTPLVRITYSHKLTDVPRRISRIAEDNGGAHLFWKEIPKEPEDMTTLEGMPNLKKGEALDLITCLPQQVDPKESPAVFALAQRLLGAGSSKEDKDMELERWKKEMLQ